MVFEIENPFSWIFNAISTEKSCLNSMPFLTCQLYIRTLEFSRLLNPDWSIQISRARAVCKALASSREYAASWPEWVTKVLRHLAIKPIFERRGHILPPPQTMLIFVFLQQHEPQRLYNTELGGLGLSENLRLMQMN